MTCVFRVAAGPRLGYGHLMRARALARSIDADTTLLSLRGGTAARAAAKTMGWRLVDRDQALRAAGLLVVDDPGHEQGLAWIARARQHGIPTVCIHDGGATLPADLIVSAALGSALPRRRNALALSGVRFYLLDPRIARARSRRPRRGPLRARPLVLVALGGGRHVRAMAQPIVDAVRSRCPRVSVAVASGFSRSRQALRGARWLSARTGLVHALTAADIAIVAGGVTLYEAAALGVPSVGLAVVGPQRRAIRAFSARGALLDAGAGPTARLIASAALGVARLVEDQAFRARTAARARRLVDGRGAERVALRIHALVGRGAEIR